MPERLIQEQFDQLGAKVENATAELAADRKDRQDAKVAEDHRARWWRRAAIAAPLIAVVGVLVGAVGLSAARKAQDAVDAVEAARTEARATSCSERNRDRQAFNLTLLRVVGFNDDGTPSEGFSTLDPDRQARSLEFLENLRPLVSCDPDDIAAYYASDGRDGVIPIDGSDGSYSEAVTVP